MPRYLSPPQLQHRETGGTGILVSNLGTPDAPAAAAVRRYLAEFLWDPRVVELPRIPWWLVLHLFILRIRPQRVAQAYKKVWTEQGSPLLAISRNQVTALRSALQQRLPGPVRVVLGMRYGKPSIATALHELQQAGIDRLLVLPMYPQYSGSTTASTLEAVTKVLNTWRCVPELRFVRDYHDHAGYIDALANSIREHWRQHGMPEQLLFSFHGLPQRLVELGDPYYEQCQVTAQLAADRLELPNDRWLLTFQSRFGRAAWLTPDISTVLRQRAQQGLRHVAVVCPGFSADCLETLEEIALQNRKLFLDNGGRQFDYIPALNDHPDHIDALASLILNQAAGWERNP